MVNLNKPGKHRVQHDPALKDAVLICQGQRALVTLNYGPIGSIRHGDDTPIVRRTVSHPIPRRATR